MGSSFKASSEASERMRAKANALIDKANAIEAKEREEAEAKRRLEEKAKAEALVASGKPVTKEEVEAARKAMEEASSRYMRTNMGYQGKVARTQEYNALMERLRAQEKLEKLKADEESSKASAKADKIVADAQAREKTGAKDSYADSIAGKKPQALATKMEKLASKADTLADKFFGAKDQKGERAQANRAKLHETLAKQVSAIPTEVQMAIARLSGANLGDLAVAGYNALRYDKSTKPFEGGDTGDRNGEGFKYKSYGALRDEARSGRLDEKTGAFTYKGVTYEWKSESASNKIGWDPKQFAVQDKLTIKVGNQGKELDPYRLNGRVVYRGESLGIEGG
jgi:hypothetical protein